MPKITFGIIALNAQPFLVYNLRALYPFAHQIIVVEGAVRAAQSLATPDGHSLDGTVEVLKHFKEKEDPESKVLVIAAEDEGCADGFWEEKLAMSQAYARRITGDWLWQVDSDEFYFPKDLQTVIDMLDAQPGITAISFPYREFWGGFDYAQRGLYSDYQQPEAHRLFRWQPNYAYVDHRPPTVLDVQGLDLRTQNWINHHDMRRRGIYMHHYAYVFPKQAEAKVGYYSHVDWTDAFRDNRLWLDDSYYGLKAPLHIGEKRRDLQWLERYPGDHPEAIQQLRQDISNDVVEIEERDTQDIEALLISAKFRIKRQLASMYLFVFWRLRHYVKPITRYIRQSLFSQEQN